MPNAETRMPNAGMTGQLKIPAVLGCWLVLLLSAAGTAWAMDPPEQMTFADGLYLRGLYDMAVREYLLLMRDAPDLEQADAVFFRIGECYRHLGQDGAAERFYKRVMVEHPDGEHRWKAEFRRAELYVTQQQYGDAVRLLEALVAGKPPADIAAAGHYYLGYCFERQEKKSKAEKAYRKVIAEFQDSAYFSHAALALAALLEAEGKTDEARALCRRAGEQPGTPRAGAEALFQLGEMAFRAGDFDASAQAYDQLFERYPEDERVPEARLQAAWARHNTGRYEEALALLEDAAPTGRAPDGEERLYLRANCERQLQRTQEALESYTQLLERFPGGRLAGAAGYERALIAFRQGDYAAAVEQAGAVTPFTNVAEDLEWVLAESYRELGRDEEAIRHFRALTEQHGDSERNAAAAYQLASLLQKTGKYEEASRTYRAMVRKHPGHELAPKALFASAFCRTKLGQYAEALNDWNELAGSYTNAPDPEEILYQKAMAETQAGRDGEAAATLTNLLGRFPDASQAGDAHYRLALLREKAGELQEAEEHLRAGVGRKVPARLRRDMQYRLAGVLQKLERPGEAADILQELLDTPFKSEMPPDLLEWLARFRLEKGQAAEAAQAARALVDASDAGTWKEMGLHLLGQSLVAGGDTDGAREAFEQSLALDARTGEGARSALALARIALDGQALDDAEKYFNRAAERAAGEELIEVRARSYYGLGLVMKARGQWDTAARYFMSVAVLFDNPELTPECLFEAAQAFEKLGRETDRHGALEELETRYPGSPWTEKALGKAKDGS